MTALRRAEVDVAILGGGATGLWLLDDLVRRGHRAVLLEAEALGAGQTIASQGILHGGIKYTLGGLLTGSARAIGDLPDRWRRCLVGEDAPDLRSTRMRAQFCYLWRTRSISGRVGMIGARAGLRSASEPLEPDQWPAALEGCQGTVARVEEQVLEPASMLAALARPHAGRIHLVDAASGIEFAPAPEADAAPIIRLINPTSGAPLDLRAGAIVLAAGGGNAAIRELVGLPTGAMQRRPLRMVLVRGELPPLNGHCVDGRSTRVTITTTSDSGGTPIWQVGGQIAEEGPGMDARSLVRRAIDELCDTVPAFDPGRVALSTHAVDRAEQAAPRRARPETEGILVDDRIVTVWPTKLVLVPRAAEAVRRVIEDRLGVRPAAVPDDGPPTGGAGSLGDWPRPTIALPPWEQRREWFDASSAGAA